MPCFAQSVAGSCFSCGIQYIEIYDTLIILVYPWDIICRIINSLRRVGKRKKGKQKGRKERRKRAQYYSHIYSIILHRADASVSDPSTK